MSDKHYEEGLYRDYMPDILTHIFERDEQAERAVAAWAAVKKAAKDWAAWIFAHQACAGLPTAVELLRDWADDIGDEAPGDVAFLRSLADALKREEDGDAVVP